MEFTCLSITVFLPVLTRTPLMVLHAGAGYAGAVVARRMAENLQPKAAIFERRNQDSAGNAYDRLDDAEKVLLVTSIGPHTSHHE